MFSPLQRAAERLSVLRELPRLAAQLTDVLGGQAAAVPPAAPGRIAAGPRATAIGAGEVADASIRTAAVATALAALASSALPALTFLSALTLLTFLALAFWPC